MLNVYSKCGSSRGQGFDRRDFLKLGTLGASGLSLAQFLAMKARGEVAGGQAKSVIQLWMGGGPCHVDTFDPKPNAGPDYCGPYRKPLATKVDGMQLGEKLPLLARQAERLAILRGMTHMNNGHETATYIMQTGTVPTSDLVYPAQGAVVALKKTESKAYQGPLPPYVAVAQPLGRFSEAGFLGSAYKAFATGGNPNTEKFSIGGLSTEGVAAQTESRRALAQAFDGLARKLDHDPQMRDMDAYQGKAYELILGEAKEAFDLSREDAKTRDRYGRTTFGQSCLLARRLVEQGVPFITVNWTGWDTHKQHFEKMATYLPELDQGFAALLEDLAARGLLDSTIVTWFGEFGRTPKVANEPPWQGGRHHFGNAFSAIVAGGGFKGGRVVGATDTKGEKVTERPIYPWDLSASIYRLLGIDPAGQLPHPRGCVAYITPRLTGEIQSGGMLTEIM